MARARFFRRRAPEPTGPRFDVLEWARETQRRTMALGAEAAQAAACGDLDRLVGIRVQLEGLRAEGLAVRRRQLAERGVTTDPWAGDDSQGEKP